MNADTITEPLPDGVELEHLSAGRVAGDCMSGDHIYDGDWLLIDHDLEARDGDIAVVRITVDGHRGPVVKRVRYDGPVLRSLEPSNPSYEPIMVTPEHQAVVEGVCVGVVRFTDLSRPRGAASRRYGARGAPGLPCEPGAPPVNREG